jgi:hypothetical protein
MSDHDQSKAAVDRRPVKRAPPHGLPRAKIEAGIELAGYQLWRVKKPAPVAVAEETA